MKTTVTRSLIFAAITIFTVVFSISFKTAERNKSNNLLAMSTFSNVSIGNQLNPKGMYINMSTGKVYTQQEAFNNQGEIDFAWLMAGKSSATSHFFSSPHQIAEYFNLNLPDARDPLRNFFSNAKYGFTKWTTVNQCALRSTGSVTEGQFNTITTGAQLMKYYKKNSMDGVELDLSVGDVVQFKTHNGKAGLFLVKKITGNKTTSGEMVVDIKVMK